MLGVEAVCAGDDVGSLIGTLAAEIGTRTAGSPAAAAASDAIAGALHELGLEPRVQEFRFLDFRPELPQLTVAGTPWQAGPCLYAPAGEVEGPVCPVGDLVLLRGVFETPVFAVGTHGRLYVNTRGPAIPMLAPSPANLGGPSAWVGAADGARLRELAGVNATLRTGGELLPNQLDRNVIAEVRGESEERVVVCAHVDSIWRCPGAVDNASGIEGLRRVAERFRDQRLRRTLVFCAFGAEELGLLGSTHYVAEARLTGELDHIRAVVNLDSIARGKALELIVSDELSAYLDGFPNVRPLVPGSDHWPFAQAGIPALALTVHPYAEYHTPAETVELVDAHKLDDAVDAACRIVQRLLA